MPQCSLCMQIKRYIYCTYGRGEREKKCDAVPGVRLQMMSDLFFQSKVEFDLGAVSEQSTFLPCITKQTGRTE